MSLAPFILIGCGGSGVLSVRHVRDEVQMRLKARGVDKLPAAWQFIGIDSVRVQSDLAEANPLPPSDFVTISAGVSSFKDVETILLAGHVPASAASGYDELVGWRPYFGDVTGDPGIGMGQNRALGRFAGTHALNAPGVGNRLRSAVDACQSGTAELVALAGRLRVSAGLDAPPLIVVVLGSSAGGTGAGIMLDVVDVVKRQGHKSIEPVMVVFGPDIFERPSSGMSSNGLTFLAEALNATWSEDGGKTGLFPAHQGLPQRRGSGYTFFIGRTNFRGQDLTNSRYAYRAVGLSIAGWMTTPSVRTKLQEHVLGNWSASPIRLGGMGFASQAMPGTASSFGSATIGVGRNRFRDYARAFLLRDIYEHHAIRGNSGKGFKRVALNAFGANGDQGTDPAIVSRLVSKFLPDVMKELALVNSFDADGGIKEGDDAQISGALLSKDHVTAFAESVKEKILEALPGESLRAADWVALFRDEEARMRGNVLAGGDDQYRQRELTWLQSLTARAIALGNEYLTRLTLPVMIEISAGLVSEVQRATVGFRTSAEIAETKAKEFHSKKDNELADIGSSRLDKNSPQVVEAATWAGRAYAQQMKQRVSQQIASALDQVVINLLQPIRSAYLRAEEDVKEMTERQYDDAPVITKWPEGPVVPSAFKPSPIEYLLEEWDEWPATLQRLLREAEPESFPGEAAPDRVRRGICKGTDMPGDLPSGHSRPLLWTRDSAPLTFSRNQPLALEIGLQQRDLSERVDKWLTRPGRDLGTHLSEGLGTYLRDQEHPEHNRRLNRFKEKLQTALHQASPLVQVDTTYFATAYPDHQLDLTFAVEPLPFQPGHPAYEAAEQILRDALGLPANQPMGLYFDPEDRESVGVSSFFDKPFFPGIMSSVTTPIAKAGGSVKNNPIGLRNWLDFKRARTLDEFVPLPPVVTSALIRGFAVGRLLGLVKLGSSGPTQVAGRGVVHNFPYPSYAPIEKEYDLTSILLSIPLTFVDLRAQGQKAFDAYGALFDYGVTNQQLITASQFSVTGEWLAFLDEGTTSITPIDAAQRSAMSAATRQERGDKMLANLTQNIDFYASLLAQGYDGTEYVRRGMNYARGTILVREIAPLALESYRIVRDALAQKMGMSQTGSGPLPAT
jgi:hypothetical protein